MSVDNYEKGERDMRRLTKLGASLAALAALASGGAAIAGAAGNASPPSPPPAVQPQDGDSVQQGDQTSPDTGSAMETSGEAPAASETGSEVANSDGPAGHADEPGNASADYQFQGEQ
jgi:hypothetical protein